MIVDKILDFIFEDEEEEVINDKAKAETLHFLLKRMYIEITQCNAVEADHLATCKLGEFVHFGKVDEALKGLWQRL